MPKRALIALASLGLLATACISSSTPPVDYGSGSRFVPFVVDSTDDMGSGDSVALTADGLPYISYFGFAAKLEEGAIAVPRPFGSPTVPGVMLSTSSSDGLWQRGAVEMTTPAAGLDPVGVTVPFGPVKTGDLDLTANNTNGSSVTVDASGGVHVAWAAGNGIMHATSKLGGQATVDDVFALKETIDEAGPIGRPGITVDADGNPWIAFTIETRKGLEVHVVHLEGDRWVDAVAASFPSCNGCPPPQPSGIGIVGGSPTVVYADPAARQVRAATLDGGKWTEMSVAANVIGFGLSFAAQEDVASAAYYTGDGAVDVATWGDGAWTTAKVADATDPSPTATGSGAPNTAVATDANGTVYVAWEDGGIQLASGTNSSFSRVDIGNTAKTGADPALATSKEGVALGWYDTLTQNQMLGYLGDLTDVVVARPSPSLTVSSSTGGTAECGKDKTVALDISASGTAFDTSCLVAAAGNPFTITFANDDTPVHNIAIYTDSNATDSKFVGDPVQPGQTAHYDVDALDAGSYFFRCDFHPLQMTGTFAVVKGAK
jgi:plastocyanin